MPNNTEPDADNDQEPRTRGHIERTILHHMAGEDGTVKPTTVGQVLPDIAAVIKRGGYANVGPNGAEKGTVRKSTIRRTFTQLHEKGLVRRVGELAESELRSDEFDLGTLPADGDPTDPGAYSRTSDDARVTDWVLTGEGREEVGRLDARYAAEVDELAARYGRPRGETITRIDA